MMTQSTLDTILSEQDPQKKAARLQCLAQEMRLKTFDILHEKGTGHWGGASSIAELMAALYFSELSIDPQDPASPDRDRFILSKGHASGMLYTTLAYRGYFPQEELASFRQLNSRLQGHPCMNETPGVDMSTGALGHGISVGLGMALAAPLQKRSYWTYVMVGDGCLNEGQSWEAIMAAAKFKPERLVLLIDYNRVQLDGSGAEIMPLDPLADKLRAFGWNVAPTLYDGHDLTTIGQSFAWLKEQSQWPAAIIYSTVKGKGVTFTENTHKWHGAPIDADSYAKGRPELLATLKELEAQL